MDATIKGEEHRVLVACWSVKGGVGTTVFAALLSLHFAKIADTDVLAVELGEDLGPALGVVPQAGSPGLVDWWAAGTDAPADALAGLATPVTERVALVTRGEGPWVSQDPANGAQLMHRLRDAADVVVVDCGRLDDAGADAPMARWLAAQADMSVVVVRPCYLLLRRCVSLPVEATGAVLMTEIGRGLGPADVARVTGLLVLAEITVDPSVARAVDAGLLASRLPRGLDRVLGSVVAQLRNGSEHGQ